MTIRVTRKASGWGTAAEGCFASLQNEPVSVPPDLARTPPEASLESRNLFSDDWVSTPPSLMTPKS
jgi:hypothetical protein